VQTTIANAKSTIETSALPASATRARTRKRRNLGKWLRRSAWIVLAIAIVTLVVLAWLPKPVVVDTYVVRGGPMQVTVDTSGRTRVKDRHVVSAPINGNLSRIDLRPNDTVERNAVLARIAPLAPMLLDARTKAETAARLSAATAAAKQARAALERARLAAAKVTQDLEESEQLFKNAAISSHAVEQAQFERRVRAEELASAEFANQVAEHEIDVVRASLRRFSGGQSDEFEVTSPARGRVLKVVRESAGVVQPGTPLLEIGDPAALEIVSDVLTSDAVHIPPAARVTIERWGGDAPLLGRVRYVEPSAFTRVSALGIEEQRVNVVIDLDAPNERWAALGDGYRVETRVVIWEASDIVKISSSAAFRQGDGWAVFVVQDDVARLRTVEIGRRNESDFEVRRGLNDGDVVIVHPGQRVTDGQRVAQR
jgi:HlyD family secretion protein